MKDTGKRITWTLGVWLSMLAVYYAVICMINFSGVPAFYDTDMYADVYYAMKVWNHKSLFPESWVFGNQLYAFSTPVVAALFYGILGSPHLAMGLASTVMSLLMLYCFDWMLCPVFKTLESRLAAIVMLMSVSLFCGTAIQGNAGWTLFFTMCSYYAGYMITAFLAFGCCLRRDILSSKKGVAIFGFTCFLSFCAGIQSVRQTAVMVFPMLITEFGCMLLRAVRNGWKKCLDRQSMLTVGLITLSNLLGLIAVRMMEINQVEILAPLKIVSPGELAASIKGCIIMVCSLLLNETAVSLPMMGVLLLVCAAAFFTMFRKGIKSENTQAWMLFILMAASVLVIVGIDILTNMYVRPRYYFMLYPLIGYLAAFSYDGGKKWWKIILVCFGVVFFAVSFASELVNPCLQVVNREEDGSYEISDYLVEKGYTTVFSDWNHGEKVAMASDGKIIASFWLDPDRPFEAVEYLCDPGVITGDPDHCAYLFWGEEAAAYGKEAAESKDTALELLQYFPDSDVYAFSAPKNLMVLFQ